MLRPDSNARRIAESEIDDRCVFYLSALLRAWLTPGGEAARRQYAKTKCKVCKR